MVAAPLVAAEISRLWERRAQEATARSPWRILWALGEDQKASFQRVSPWSAALLWVAILVTPAWKWPGDFPREKFPVSLVHAEAAHLTGSRVFTLDQWGDYLIYRNWPGQKVFIDGRSDFYGREIGRDYLRLAEGRPGWESLFHKYDFDAALVPREWPLAALLDRDAGWRRIRADQLAVLFERRPAEPSERANQIARLDR